MRERHKTFIKFRNVQYLLFVIFVFSFTNKQLINEFYKFKEHMNFVMTNFIVMAKKCLIFSKILFNE